jgi:hypothetical protein
VKSLVPVLATCVLRAAGTVSRLFQLPLPAGRYVIPVEGQSMEVDLVDGQTHTIDVP